jgi:hypothetical protein
LVVITAKVQIALALHGEASQRQLLMRSEPETLGTVLGLIEQRLKQDSPDQALALHQALEALGPLESSSALGQTFWPSLAVRLASMAPTVTLQASTSAPAQNHQQPQTTSEQGSAASKADEELSLLEAIAHEVRTPLATIRTLIRSLLRRNDLPETAIKRLEMIDTECSEQIDRFGLIFQAAELQRQPEGPSVLAQTDLGSMISLLTPSWEQQLGRRGIELTLSIASNLPSVLSDPSRLEPMLGGLGGSLQSRPSQWKPARSHPSTRWSSSQVATARPKSCRTWRRARQSRTNRPTWPRAELESRHRKFATQSNRYQALTRPTRWPAHPETRSRFDRVFPFSPALLTGVKIPGQKGDQARTAMLIFLHHGMPNFEDSYDSIRLNRSAPPVHRQHRRPA